MAIFLRYIKNDAITPMNAIIPMEVSHQLSDDDTPGSKQG
jgi:hypothetical protein